MKNPDFKAHKYQYLYNQGFENRIIFSSEEDYNRFEAYLYILNSIESPRASNILSRGKSHEVFEIARGEKLVAIGSYAFTPREFQLIATPLIEGGISKFMQKLLTAYTMYFNHKYARSGALFHSAYRSTIVQSEEHLKYVHAVVHLSPAFLFDAQWQEKGSSELQKIATSALHYRYSSIGEYIALKPVITSPEYYPRYFYTTRDADTHLKNYHKFHSRYSSFR